MRQFSVRTHLLLLALAVSVPLVVLVGVAIYSDMHQGIAQTKASLRALANMMVNNTSGKIANAHQMLERVALRPAVRRVDAEHCDEALTDLLSMNPGYTNVSYTDLQGMVICSSVPQLGGKPVNLGETAAFQKFLKQRSFSVGDPYWGNRSGKWISILRAPIWNERQELVGATQLPLDLAIFDPQIPPQFLLANSHYGLVTQDGILIWRNIDRKGAIGVRGDSDAVRRMVKVRNGEFESRSADGVLHYFVVVPLPESEWLAFVGVPASVIYGEAKQRAITATIVVLVTIALMFLLAIVIARRIVRPVVALERAARAVHHGEIDVRVTVEGPREIAAVAQEF